MPEMTSEERVLRVLQRKEPDRVPHFEWAVDHRVREALCPGCKSHTDFAVQMGHDAILVDPIIRRKELVQIAGSVSGDTFLRIPMKSMASKWNRRSRRC